MTDQAWLDHAGNFHSTEAHIVERYRLTGPDALEYEARIEDPVVYSMPWTLRTVLYRVKQPGARIIEDECLDDANGVRHHIYPSDPRNLLKSDYSRWSEAGAEIEVTRLDAAAQATPTLILCPQRYTISGKFPQRDS